MSTFIAQASENADAEDAVERLDAAIALCTRVHGADDVRIAHLRLLKIGIDFGAGRYRAVHDEALHLSPTFRALGQDRHVAAAEINRAVAAYKLDQPGWDDEPLTAAKAWSAYALGDDNDLTEDLRRAGGG